METQASGAPNGIEKVVAACSAVTDDWRHQRLITVGVLASFRTDTNQPRLPFYPILGTGVDLLAVRGLLKGILNTDGFLVQVDALTAPTLTTDQGTPQCLLLDMTAANAGQFYHAMQLAYARCIPGNAIILKKKRTPIYGDTWILAPEALAGDISAWGIVLELERHGPACVNIDELTASLADVKGSLRELSRQAELRIDPSELPSSQYLGVSVRRGYLYLAALGRWLDTIFPPGRFLDAVRECMKDADRRASGRAPTRLKHAILCRIVLDYISAPERKPDYKGGYREDSLAAHVHEACPEHYGKLDGTELGKIFSRIGVGTISRHGFVPAEGAPRQWRSLVMFSKDDIAKMVERAAELEGGR